MVDLLMEMSGEQCYTLSYDNPATIWVAEDGIEVVYPSGKMVFIPLAMVVRGINMLVNRGQLTVDEVHQEITSEHSTRTDKLTAFLRKLPGVSFDKFPRVLYFDNP